MAYLGHALAIKEDLSALENLHFVWDFHGQGETTPQDALERAGLARVAHQAARTLSAGQRKRCALARLLITAAPVWLLDEPYSNLDQSGIELVDQLLLQHLSTGGAAVMTTHGAHRPDWQRQHELHLIPGFVH
jgi:heme exporter protein A